MYASESVYCTRVFAIEAILWSAEKDSQDEDDDRRFLETRVRFLANSRYCPISKMISLLASGKVLARDHSDQGADISDI